MPVQEEDLLRIIRAYNAETEKADAKKNEGATLKTILNQQQLSETNILRTFQEHEDKDNSRHDDILDMIRAFRVRIKEEVKKELERMSLPPGRGREISEHDLDLKLKAQIEGYETTKKAKAYDFLQSVAGKVLVMVLGALALLGVGAMIGKHLLP